jgi:site-specific DNA-methyltransferase (adenine-specific)
MDTSRIRPSRFSNAISGSTVSAMAGHLATADRSHTAAVIRSAPPLRNWRPTDLRETPLDLFDKSDREFHFTLDPCATATNARCPYFNVNDDSLEQSWADGVVSLTRPIHRSPGGLPKPGEKHTPVPPS